MKVLLVEIDDNFIKFAQGYTNKDIVINCDQVEAKYAIKKGRIIDKYVLRNIIKDYMHKYQMKIRNVAIIIKSPDIILKHMELSNIKPREMKKAFYSNVKMQLPIDTKKYTIDYKVLSQNKVLAVAILNDVLYDYIQFFKEIHLNLIHVDIIQNCISKVFQYNQNKKIIIFLKIGERLCLINLFDGIIENSREIKFDADFMYYEFNKILDTNKFHEVYLLGEGMDLIAKYFNSISVEYNFYDEEEIRFAALKHIFA